ncbi:MAG: ABC transporter permease, partial [Thermomicrobiales bacterium]
GISVISYGIIRLAPGDPARVLADPEMLTTEQMEALRVQLGLDQPIAVQYLRTMQSLLTGDLLSFKTRQPVIEMIVERLPTTLALTGCVLVIGFTMGMAIGVLQALRPNSRLDDMLTFLSLFGFAVPSFWLALMLILVFSMRLDWLPASGIRPTNTSGWNPVDVAPYLILPTIVLTANLLASVARYTRSSMLETLNQDYLRTARAKGLSERTVTVVHALRNSLLPVITLLGVQIPYLLGGTVAIETIFALPGVGRLALDSVISRDYPVILTINVFVAVLVLIGNLLADIAYGLADPRVRLGE